MPVYPTPAALITAVDERGRANIITKAGEFTVNLPTTKILRQVDRCGTVSGRKVDKFREFGLTPLAGTQVKAPLIAECPINLECRLLGIEEIGDHDMFKGQVLVQHVDEEVLDASGRIRVDKLDPVCYLMGEYWSAGAKLGWHGYTTSRSEG